MDLDLAIRGGLVVDGTGGPARHADIGISGDRIVAVEDHLAGHARREIVRRMRPRVAWSARFLVHFAIVCRATLDHLPRSIEGLRPVHRANLFTTVFSTGR